MIRSSLEGFEKEFRNDRIIKGVRIGGITPDGKTLYAIYAQDGLGGPSWTIDSISTGTDTVTDAIPLATMGPGEMVFTP